MNQEQALQAAKELYPAIADFLAIERTRRIGFEFGWPNSFKLWNHSDRRAEILASSETSWENLIDVARANILTPVADVPHDDEVPA